MKAVHVEVINKRKAITLGWEFCSHCYHLKKRKEKEKKRKEKKRKEKKRKERNYYNVRYLYLVSQPSSNTIKQDSTLLIR